MPIPCRYLLAIALVPTIATAQTGSTPAEGDGIRYRVSASWEVINQVQLPGARGAVLSYQPDGDTLVTMAIISHTVPRGRSLAGWSDSVLARARPGAAATMLRDSTEMISGRSVLWTDSTLIAMDRFVRTTNGILWVRVVLPTVSLRASSIRNRLRAIDDVMTTIRDGARMLFPDGSQLGITVRAF